MTTGRADLEMLEPSPSPSPAGDPSVCDTAPHRRSHRPAAGCLLNLGQLAEAMGVSRWYVWTMKRAGFAFSHGSRCTLKHALKWLQGNPDFRTTVHRLRPAYARRAA